VNVVKAPLRTCFELLESLLDRAFGPAWNPLANLGALGFFYYWIVAISGLYLYIFFDTGITEAYGSVEYLTHDQRYLGGVMRSLHRYASDGMVAVMLIHIVREFSLDRYRGPRWFSWVTGLPVMVFVFACGITGYWLVWDQLAQYVAITTSEFLDWLPIFGEAIAHNFVSPADLDDRFFSLMAFIHIAAPLILLLILWIHLQRISRPRINPPRGLAIGTSAMMLVLSLALPAVSHGPADLAKVPTDLHLDWFYLAAYPLLDRWDHGVVWGAALALAVIFVMVPFMPPMRRLSVATIDLSNCNGCTRCAEDCPFNAISMVPRTDERRYDRQASVTARLCVSCGVCVGACPTATPFRRTAPPAAGIELPHLSIAELRDRVDESCRALTQSPRVIVFACDYGAHAASIQHEGMAVVNLPCIGMLPVSFIDYALSRGLSEGVVLTGCRTGECHARQGVEWATARIEGRRDPRLRARVPRDRVLVVEAATSDLAKLQRQISDFRDRLETLPPEASVHRPTAPSSGGPAEPNRAQASAHE